jgi:hypothetical protein
MRPETPQSLKRTVIQPYFRGVSRNETASRTGISQESVSNITTRWKTGLGYPEPDNLRDLGIMLQNAGMTAPQCAEGLRIVHIMQSLGIDEEFQNLYLRNLSALHRNWTSTAKSR